VTLDLAKAFAEIEVDPNVGVVIPNDYSIRKLRISSSDMEKGKRGGFRLLYKLSSDDPELVEANLLFLYVKVDQSDVSSAFLETLLIDSDDT
jgi:hypothetical protein